ncbi:hypothetical protein ACIA5D_45390 [Actinoplanes sp. NPDC051513]|uniref:hypothetical protein n=1 Tax=Actinoplanes sp. NPDC051513 TaxID=3363908 RepID=UPI0037B783C2
MSATTAVTPSTAGAEAPRARRSARYLTIAAVTAAVAYPATWIVGLSIASSGTTVHSTGAEILSSYAGHTGAALVQFLLTEGVAGLLLAVAVVAVGRAGGGRAGRWFTGAGLVAAAISVAQCGLGVALTGWAVPHERAGAALALTQVVNRADGVKMLLLAAVAVLGWNLARRGRLPRWIGFLGLALAVAIAVSGLGFLLLSDTLSMAAYVSLPLLLVFVTAACLAVSRRTRTGAR